MTDAPAPLSLEELIGGLNSLASMPIRQLNGFRKMLREAADRLAELELKIAANVELSRLVSGHDRSRDARAVHDQAEFIGGCDVCLTCNAHCCVMEVDEPRLAELEREVNQHTTTISILLTKIAELEAQQRELEQLCDTVEQGKTDAWWIDSIRRIIKGGRRRED